MNTERTSSSASRSSAAISSASTLSGPLLRRFRVFFAWMAAALLLVGLAATASQAGLKPAQASGTGAVLALVAQLRSARDHANTSANNAARQLSSGRALLPRRMMHPGALVSRAATAASVVPITGGVQTYDVNNPPPAFRPLVGYGSLTALNNNSSNPPVYIPALTPTNLTPVWSADESFLIFSSNRTQTGGVNADGLDGGSRFHLWAIPVSGGEAYQITTSIGPSGGGEFFPTLSQNNLSVAFTSDAQSYGTQNLFAFGFSYSALVAGAVAVNLSPSATNTNAPASLTLRAATEAASAGLTGFDQVLRPTFSPNDGQLIVFSAHSVVPTNYPDQYAGADHLYFLYTSSGGFSQGNNVSYPGKLTNGPASDTDPTFAPDGSYIAFASTASAAGFTRNSNNAFGPTTPSSPQDPNQSQSLSSGTATTRSVFLISGGLSATGVPFGTVPNSGTVNLSSTGGRVSRGSPSGFDDFAPAWSSFANQNQYTNVGGNFGYLAFSRSGAGVASPHDIYFFLAATGVSDPTTESLTRETGAGNGNASVKLNTDDNAGETSTAGNAYDDSYPVWSPGVSTFSIAYSSTRTVTYNNPNGGAPVEVAVSVAPGGAITNSQDSTQNYTVGAGYEGILVSQILNLDPPTLLRFNINEVVHVQAGSNPNPVTGTANKLAASGGQAVTLTVRLSDREAGIDNTGGPNGGPRVYVQIKDPDGKYQDSQNTEHKVFMRDRRFDSQPVYNTAGAVTGNGPQYNARLRDLTSGTADALLDVYNYALPTSDLYSSLYFVVGNFFAVPSYKRYQYPSYGDVNDIINNIGINPSATRGVHGGQYIADTTNNPFGTYIFVGKSGGGTNDGTKSGTQQPTDEGKPFPTAAPAGTNPVTPAVPASSYTFPVPGGRAALPYPYSDPRQFIPTGAEYECQVVNPQFLSNGLGTGATSTGDPTVTGAYPGGYTMNADRTITAHTNGAIGDYVSPYWLAGVEDQGAFSGGTYQASAFTSDTSTGRTGTDRPVASYTSTGTAVDGTATTTTHPAEWLQLTQVPAAQQDNNGGVLYTVTWTTPTGDSDFYVDVIAYDKAAFPNVPGSRYSGSKTNWRIYDNVSGFSTNQSVGSSGILVVSDYALGQKFAGTTFGGRNTNQNLVPKLFGTESYVTDVDINILPDSSYVGIPTTEKSYAFNPVVQPFISDNLSRVANPFSPNSPIYTVTQTGAENGLGALSYQDGITNDNVFTNDGAPFNQSQQYSIWRILSRGPVPASTLSTYLPTPFNQPAVADPAGITAPAATVLDAPRCVVWLSPYTGDVLTDPGTIDDPGNVGTVGVTNPRPSTTSILTAFVRAGGRLCVTGQDVGSTLTQNGTVGNTPSQNGTPNFLPDVLNATVVPNVSGGNVLAGTDNRIAGNPFYDHYNNGNYGTLAGPIQGPYVLQSPNYPYQDNLVLGDADYGDGALSQIPALTIAGASVQGQTDVLNATSGAIVAMTYGGGGTAMVFHNDPYNPAGSGKLPNGGTGSRVVYAGFGLEGLSNDFYSSNQPNPSEGPAANQIIPEDQLIPLVLPRNPRSAVLHNIVSYLRTGRVTGTITQTAGSGQGAGTGIPGATVYLQPITGQAPPTRTTFSATTTSGGLFTIFGVEPGTYTLVAVKPGFQRAVSNAGVSFTVEGDTTASNATLTMAPQQPGNIAGTVHDNAATPNPISGSVVTFTSQDNSVTVSATTVNGSITGNPAENYFIQNVPVTTYTAKASSPLNPTGQPEYTAANAPDKSATPPDYSQGVTVQPSTTVQPVNFTLTPILATISGTVSSNATGTPPVPGATVTLLDSTGKAVGAPVVTASDGTYTFTAIPAAQTPTNYTVTVTAPGFAPATPLTETVYLGSVITNANFLLTTIPPGTIAGTVTYSTGGPVAGAVVSYTAPGATTAQTTTTAADGTYTIAGVPPSTYSVSAIGPNNTTRSVPTTTAAPAQSVTVTSGNTSPANFVVTPIEPSFTGTVFSAPTTKGSTTTPGTALKNATVTITGTTAAGATITPVTVKTDATGTYVSGTLAPGTYTLVASLAGYSPQPVGPAELQLGDSGIVENFVLTAVAPGSITGTVLDNHNVPVSNATVTFNSTDGTVSNLTAKTTTSGTYVIPPPAPTTVTVPASTYTGSAVGTSNETGTPQYTPSATQTVTVPPGGSATANFTLNVIPASVSGTVTDVQSQAAVGGATVTLTDANGKVIAGPVTTGADGTYSFTGILVAQAPASYTVSVTAPNYSATTVPVTLSLGDALTIPVALNEQATLIGLVTDGSANATGQPLSGAVITVTDSAGNVIATTPATVTTLSGATTAADGQPENYTATLLPGKYIITATKGGYTSQASALVTLTNTAPVRVNFALVSAVGTLGGLVTDQNGTGLVSGATVTAIPTGATAGLSFTTNASSTPGPDGSPINYTGQLAQGTYSVTVTKGSRTSAAQTVTVVGGAFTRLDFTAANGLPALHTFPAGIQFVSTPYDYSAIGFNGLFGTLNTAPAGTTSNGNRSNVAVWNPLTGAYALDPNAPADALRLGVGYWVYLKNPTAVTQQGAAAPSGFVAVSLGQGWNQIGVPNPASAGIPVASLMFDSGTGGKITFAQASSSQYNLVTRPLYGYAGGGYQQLGATGVLAPWSGYWIYVNTAATLEIPVP